jgi:hypothetical protein
VAERTSFGTQIERKTQHLEQQLTDGIPHNSAVAESEVMMEMGYFERTDDDFDRMLADKDWQDPRWPEKEPGFIIRTRRDVMEMKLDLKDLIEHQAAFQKRTDRTLYAIIVMTALILGFTVIRPLLS